ncbi:accessory gene regulator B family protein [Anaerobacillus sp. CMMVII]|uniref:accessory gene regulator B family protein n=1 Tax=Anaerobacillus sp. CMMVII TaxID=2755588 RepID=UPI0021B775D0|nr:accessory gene regulator B family protein [Anaerobacillus sp. CMMVII]MCT8139394.1 accessory gene regulator B family protein [Anaerobacillus sp. CMMVII]
MTNYVSTKIAEALGEYVERKTEVDYIRYGIEIMFNGLIKLLVLLGASYLLGLFHPMLWIFSTFVVFRGLTGGHHYSTFLRCLVVGLTMMLGISYLTVRIKDIFDFNFLIALLFIALTFGLILVYKFAPSNHFYKKCNDYQKNKLRKYSLYAVSLWGLLMYFLITNSYSTELVLASIFGFLFQIGSIHPYSYLFVNKIEKMIERG